MLETQLEEIKYVAIEIIGKDNTKASDIECGLFMGIIKKLDKENVENIFLALILSEDTIKLYNITEYTIVTIDIVDKDSRYFTVFTNKAGDQEIALKVLNRVVDIMAKDNRLYLNDHNKELIDIDTYGDFPDTIFSSNSLTQEEKNVTNGSNNTTVGKKAEKKPKDSTIASDTKEPKGPIVTNIKREGKLPNKKKLISMKEKVMRIANGTFKIKDLPVLTCDKVSTKGATDKEEIAKCYNMYM